MAQYEVVYWELNRLSRLVEADSLEQAINISEAKRAKHDWEDCEEESEGTNGVERVYLHKPPEMLPKLVYSSGTIAGFEWPHDNE